MEYLDASGIVDITDLSLNSNIRQLYISYCYNARDFYYNSLEILDVSNLDLTSLEIQKNFVIKAPETVESVMEQQIYRFAL